MTRRLFLTAPAAERIREEIQLARGNEVCFLASVGAAGEVFDPAPVARGHRNGVLAAARDAEPGTLVLHNHPSGDLDPSDADLEVASRLYERGLGLAITDNEARRLYVVVEPPDRREIRPLDPEAVAAALAPGGPVAGAHPSYEDRPTQRDLTHAVAEAYNERRVLMAEAGTGTGKSIAYLLPAIRWAAANGERTIVSTNTINLQEQLAGKDLPFLGRALGERVRFALVKGRGNYVSIRRALLARETSASLFDDGRRRELDTIVEWTKGTAEGSLQDLPFQPSSEVWDEVASETDVCLRARCPHFEACFYQKARRAASSADVLVVNHHLLFSDLAVRRASGNWTAPAVLPPYRRVVLDEAHNLEDAATQHLGASLSRRGLFRLLGRLERRGKGLLPGLASRLSIVDQDLVTAEVLREVEEELRPAVERAREHGTELFRRLGLLLQGRDTTLTRIDHALRSEPAWGAVVEPALEDLSIVVEGLARSLERVCEKIGLDQRWAEKLEEQLLELRAAASRSRAALSALRLALDGGRDEVPMVRWIERRGAGGSEADRGGSDDDASSGSTVQDEGPGSGRPDTESLREAVAALRAADPTAGNIMVRAAPVDLSALLRDALFERVDTAVLTSATLTTRDGFDFLRGRLGLATGGLRYEEAAFASPFEFETQSLIAIPTDLPPVRQQGAAFDARTADVTADLAGVTDGGIMVLFTSYRSLRRVASDLRGRGAHRRWPLFVQGEAPRARLLADFTAAGRGILLGVASFWEGVDVPGEPLRGLIIAKLPFLVPDEPVTAARAEQVEAEGRSAFAHYMLPHAALRLKQGFGRLIRSRTDRGAVVLLDGRVLGKSYGRYLLESLPAAPVTVGPWSEVLASLGSFYALGSGEYGVAIPAD